MKQDRGITLTTLLIYIFVLLIVMVGISSISSNFYKNTENLKGDTKDLLELSKFNEYFVKEVKAANNKVDTIADNGTYILFTSGNSFMLKDHHIFYNQLDIAKNVSNLEFAYGKDFNDQTSQDIIKVTIKFENYEKTINYKLEEMY